MSPSLNAEHISRILEAARRNDQAYASVLARRELEQLRLATVKHPGVPALFDAFDEWSKAPIAPAGGTGEGSASVRRPPGRSLDQGCGVCPDIDRVGDCHWSRDVGLSVVVGLVWRLRMALALRAALRPGDLLV